MPQFDVSKFESQVIWLLILFLVFYGALKKWVLPAFQDIQRKRWERLEGTLGMIEHIKEEIVKMDAQTEKRLEAARAHTQQMMSQALADIEKARSRKMAKLQQELEARLETTEHHLNEQRHLLTTELDERAQQLSQIVWQEILKIPAKRVAGQK